VTVSVTKEVAVLTTVTLAARDHGSGGVFDGTDQRGGRFGP
jgi:hypothetical protein